MDEWILWIEWESRIHKYVHENLSIGNWNGFIKPTQELWENSNIYEIVNWKYLNLTSLIKN